MIWHNKNVLHRKVVLAIFRRMEREKERETYEQEKAEFGADPAFCPLF